MVSRQWYIEDPCRLGEENMAVSVRLPAFRFLRTTEGTMILKGPLHSTGGKEYQVALVYPPDYPQTAPRVYPIPRLVGPHTFVDGAMCLFRPDDRTWTSDSTAVTVLAIAAVWLSIREYWQKHGQWLGRQHT